MFTELLVQNFKHLIELQISKYDSKLQEYFNKQDKFVFKDLKRIIILCDQ